MLLYESENLTVFRGYLYHSGWLQTGLCAVHTDKNFMWWWLTTNAPFLVDYELGGRIPTYGHLHTATCDAL
jgi:hypothetical protein